MNLYYITDLELNLLNMPDYNIFNDYTISSRNFLITLPARTLHALT